MSGVQHVEMTARDLRMLADAMGIADQVDVSMLDRVASEYWHLVARTPVDGFYCQRCHETYPLPCTRVWTEDAWVCEPCYHGAGWDGAVVEPCSCPASRNDEAPCLCDERITDDGEVVTADGASIGAEVEPWHGLVEWERTRARQAARWAREDGASWVDVRRAVLRSLGTNVDLVDLIETDQRWVSDLLGPNVETDECQGHPAGPLDVGPGTFYCDGPTCEHGVHADRCG